MIIILGSDKDEHCIHVAKSLEKINEKYIFLDTRDYPQNVLINWRADLYNEGCITINNTKIDFKDIKSVYWRNFYGVKYEKIDDGENTNFLSSMIHRERKSALYSLFHSLDLNWVNSINAFELHKKKAYLTNILNSNNIRVPKTLITNDKDNIIDFFEQNNNEVIVKPVLGGAYTEKIEKDNLTNDRLDLLKVSPVQFQEFIDGIDIRVYAYKNKLFALKIISDTVDFRQDLNAKLIPIELPEIVRNDCFKVMKLLELKYSGIDIRLNKKGEYVFIEANPAPMFIHVENITKFPLTNSLIELLTE